MKRIRISTFITVINSILFFLFFVSMIFIINMVMKKHALSEAEEKARIILDHNLAIHSYFNKTLKPDMFRYLESTGHTGDSMVFNPVWMSSTYAVRGIDRYFDEIDRSDFYYKECAINARSPANEADAWEKDFIERLNADMNLTMQSAIREIGGRLYFTVLRRGESMEDTCLRCHSTPVKSPRGLVEHYGPVRSFNRHLGETVSAISIRIPLNDAYSHADSLSLQLAGALIMFMLILFIVQKKILNRYIFSPVNAVSSSAAEVAGDRLHLWKEVPLPFGEELRTLTGDFNTMARSLIDQSRTLEERVQERTEELERANENLHQEIEQRKEAQERLRKSLDEKEMLMREIHHRVKNNLQMVMSLINIQAQGLSDEALAERLGDLNNRIRSMSMVHEKLYLSGNISQINLAEYIQGISREIMASYPGGESRISMHVTSDELFIGIDQAIPCGLVVNEIITNSMKHAFPQGAQGEITVKLTALPGDMAELAIGDNGIGMSKGNKGDHSFGLELVRHIMKNQLRGQVEVSEEGGTSYRITFMVRK